MDAVQNGYEILEFLGIVDIDGCSLWDATKSSWEFPPIKPELWMIKSCKS